jgi:DNA-binding IclR family transcriptional regulator
MFGETDYTAKKERITGYLKALTAERADTTTGIAKRTGMTRRQASEVLQRMETEHLVVRAGVVAGVDGFRLAK